MKYIENKNQLIDYFIEGSKSKLEWRIGTEHEKFLFDLKNKNSIPYDGDISILKIFSKMVALCSGCTSMTSLMKRMVSRDANVDLPSNFKN